MKLVKLTPAMAARWSPASPARKCPICHRANKPGQHVLQHKLAPRIYIDTELNIHALCALALAEQAGPDDVDPTNLDAAIAALTRETKRVAKAQRAA